MSETDRTLGVRVSEVQESNSHVNAIVESAREQLVGVQKINTSVNIMDAAKRRHGRAANSGKPQPLSQAVFGMKKVEVKNGS